MNEEMKFPKTFEEFIKQYSFFDKQQIYTNGSELIQVFRIKQWEEYKEKENQELKKKYENAVADYETTMAEKEQLNRLVNSCQEEIRKLKKQLETYEIEGYKQNEELDKMSFDIRKYKTQQKEFIKWLDGNTRLAPEPKKGLLNEILQKYKSIIGVSDENN